MQVIFIILLLHKIVTAENNDTKLIDLLPQKEKEEFLDKIARRILEEVQPADTEAKTSAELSDDQLNQHDAYIQKVLKEESQNLRKKSDEAKLLPTSPKPDVVSPNKKEHLRNVDSYIDLTLRTDHRNKRENNRRVYTGYVSDNESESNNGSDAEVDIQVKNFRRNTQNLDHVNHKDETTTLSDDVLDENDGFIQSQKIEVVEEDTTTRRNSNIDDITTDETIINTVEEFDSNTNNNDSVYESNKFLENTYLADTSESTYSRGTPDLIENITNNQDVINNENTTQDTSPRISRSTTDEKNIIAVNKFDRFTNSNDSVYESNTFLENITSTDNIAETLESTTSSVILEKTKNITNRQDVINNENQTQDFSPRISRSYYNESEELNVAQNEEKVKNIDDSKVINIEVTSVNESVIKAKSVNAESSTPVIQVLTTTALPTLEELAKPVDEGGVKTKGNNDIEIFLSPDSLKTYGNAVKIHDDIVDTHMKYINTENFPSALRQNAVDENTKSKQAKNYNELKHQYEKNKVTAYEVYEISPDADPFVKKDLPKSNPKTTQQPITNEQPYYVPVYNYKPENAFFDGHNIYGINSDEKEKDLYYYNKNHDNGGKRSKMNEDTNKDIYTLIYKYSPENAFYNPHNMYGPNESESEKNIYTIKQDDEDYNIEKRVDKVFTKNNRNSNDGKLNNFQWDYYFGNEALRKSHFAVTTEAPKRGKVEPFQINSPVTKVPKLTDLYFNPNEYLDIDYFPGRMGVKRPKYENCGDPCDQRETTTVPNCEDPDALLYSENGNHTNPEYLGDSIRHIRQLLLENEVFSFIKSPEDHDNLSDELDAQEIKELSYVRSKNSKPKGKTQPDISKDYYYARSRDEDEGVEEIEIDSNEKYIEKLQKVPVDVYSVLKLLQNSYGKEKNNAFETDKGAARNGVIDLETMKQIIDMVPSGKDLVTTVLELQKMYVKSPKRTTESKDVEVIVTVLGDMIKEHNKALVQYAWLETAVDLQSAIKKMGDLIDGVRSGENIHPSDLELLHYLVYLHTYAKEELFNKQYGRRLRVNSLLPRGKHRKQVITQSGLLNRVWLIRMPTKKPIPADELNAFEVFLNDLQLTLYDLHNALKYIAMVTKHKNQKWFENLKQIFIMDSKRKELLQLMLHFWTSRLLGLVEESAKNGLEDDYQRYIKKNEKEVDRTKEEFVFVLKLIQEIKRSK